MSVGSIGLSVEISLTETVTVASWSSGALALNQTGSRIAQGVMNVGTSFSAIPLSSIGTVGFLQVSSLVTTGANVIYLATTTGLTTGVAMVQLAANGVAVIPLGSGFQTPCVSASTACQMQYMAFEL